MKYLWLCSAGLLFQIGAGQTPDEAIVAAISQSGRCADVGVSPSDRVTVHPAIAPGMPPLLSFRYYEGREHQRFGNSGLVLDDAGH